MYVVYLIESELDGSYYIGQTFDLEARIKRHNSGKNKYTSKKRPWRIKMWKEVDTRSEAVYYERRLKSLKKREKIIEFGINNGFRGVAQPG
jgi:putative endonuclease